MGGLLKYYNYYTIGEYNASVKHDYEKDFSVNR